MNEKVLPETLLQLMLNVLAKADSFQYISGIQPLFNVVKREEILCVCKKSFFCIF